MSLTARLLAVVVLLVALTAAAIGTATTLAMRDQLSDRLDADVMTLLNGPRRGVVPDRHGGDGDRDDKPRLGQSLGTVQAVRTADGTLAGTVLAQRPDDEEDRGDAVGVPLTREQLVALARADEEPSTVDLPGLGAYRVAADEYDDDSLRLVGLPTGDVEDTLGSLVRLELLATLLGVAVAALVGALVVRRQLAPLREVAGTAHRVAELPLSSGEIELAERVPAHLARPGTEVGEVAVALNSMLDHVEGALADRHRSEQQVRQFVADASHELRTPLATIAGYAELARRQPGVTETALDKVSAESARMTTLVEDLLLLARLDQGRPLDQAPVDLSRLLLEAVDDARVVDPQRRWRLSLPDEPIVVTGDAARLHQVVVNLLTNARTHTPPGTTVTVTAGLGGVDRDPGFTVVDDGPGFAPDLVEHAFERFTRGDSARTRTREGVDSGAGLGLSIVRAIVEAHGGTVTLQSRPGRTQVDVRLPTQARGLGR